MNILDNLVPQQLPYAIRGGIIRGIRTGVGFILAGIATSIADGSIIQGIAIIPPAYGPFVLLGLTTTFVSVDKWLRERGLVEDAENANIPIAEELPTVEAPVNVIPENVTDQVNEIEAETVPTTDTVPDEGAVTDDVNPTEFDDPVDDTV